MKIRIVLSCLLLITISIISCSKQNITSPGNSSVSQSVTTVGNSDNISDYIDTSLTISKNRDENFDFMLFQKLQNNSDNIMISPLSLIIALSVLQNGANGSTWDSIVNAIGFENFTQKELNTYMYNTIKNISNNNKLTLNIANSIWADTSVAWEQLFFDLSLKYYQTEIAPLTTAEAINNWVANKTDNKITKLVDNIPPDLKMVIINAIYFNAKWLDPFDTTQTEEKWFYTTNKDSIKTKFMHKSKEVLSKTNNIYSAIKLPYKDSNTFAYIYLPHKNISIDTMYNKLFAGGDSYYEFTINQQSYQIDTTLIYDNNSNLFDNFSFSREVAISLPIFKFKYSKTLNDELSELGLKTLFNDPDLTKLSKTTDLYISKILQKTYIDFNENGTEAAAVTGILVATTSIEIKPPYLNFIANRPFFIVIRNDKLKQTLFMAQINNPKE